MAKKTVEAYRITRGFSADGETFEAGEEVEASFLVETIGAVLTARYAQNGRIVPVEDEPAVKADPKADKGGAVQPPLVTR